MFVYEEKNDCERLHTCWGVSGTGMIGKSVFSAHSTQLTKSDEL